jgi:hypothetical protein
MEYNDGKIKVRKSVRADVDFISTRMRKSDIDEIWASNHVEPKEALMRGLDNAIYCQTIENGTPIAMFGICPHDLLGHSATIWMLGTDSLDKIKFKFLRHSREYVDAMLDYYYYLDNYVDVRNEKSIAWLKFLGATFDEPKPYGVDGKLFQHFYFKRNVPCATR